MDGVIFCLLFAAAIAVIVLVVLRLQGRKVLRRLELAAKRQVADADVGRRVLLEGSARALDLIESPVTGARVIGYRLLVTAHSEKRSSREIERAEIASFELEDASGRIAVETAGTLALLFKRTAKGYLGGGQGKLARADARALELLVDKSLEQRAKLEASCGTAELEAILGPASSPDELRREHLERGGYRWVCYELFEGTRVLVSGCVSERASVTGEPTGSPHRSAPMQRVICAEGKPLVVSDLDEEQLRAHVKGVVDRNAIPGALLA